MPFGLYCHAPGSVMLKEYVDGPLRPTDVRIEVEFASPKHGTLNHALGGESPFVTRDFTRERLFVPLEKRRDLLVDQWIGNAVVGRIADVGSACRQSKLGERVWAYAPIRQTVDVQEQALFAMPSGLSPEAAVCIDPGHFALGAVREARVSPGDRVVVTGLGAIGLFVVQMLAQAGCDFIVAADRIPERRALALKYGATHAVDPAVTDLGTLTRSLHPRAADLAIEASGSYQALSACIRSVGQCGRVVALGFYCGQGTPLELGAEAFHNRVDIIMSLPDWGNPLRDQRWDIARIRETLTQWFISGRLDPFGIVGPVVGLDKAAAAFESAAHGHATGVKMGVRLR